MRVLLRTPTAFSTASSQPSRRRAIPRAGPGRAGRSQTQSSCQTSQPSRLARDTGITGYSARGDKPLRRHDQPTRFGRETDFLSGDGNALRRSSAGRDSVSEYSISCIDIRADELFISAEEDGQAAARAGMKDWPGSSPQATQITTAGLVPVGLSRLWYHRVTQVRPPGRSDA